MKTTDNRVYSKEGFLLSDAVIGRTGDLEYRRGDFAAEWPGNPDDVVTLSRSRKVLEDALPTMVGAPITIDHPADFVNPDNAGDLIVGSVATRPTIGDDGKVRASLRVYRRDAIDLLKNGVNQLSPGFEFTLKTKSEDTADIEGMQLNHIAIVRHGRAGPSVRVLDHLPPPVRHKQGAPDMSGNTEEMRSIIQDAIKDAMRKGAPEKGLSEEEIVDRVSDSVMKRVEPQFEAVVEKMQKAKDEADAKAKDAEAAIEQRIEDAVKAERNKIAIVNQAKPFIAEDRHEELDGMSSDDVMRLAIGDSVPGADKMNTDGLMGALLALSATKATDAKPSGVVQVGDQSKARDVMGEIYAEREKARNSGGIQ